MKNYSFSNIAAEENLMRNSTDLTAYYRHSELKAQQANQRIEEIKKKYDTPSRRQRVDSLKTSQDLQLQNRITEQSKENPIICREKASMEDSYHHRPAPTFGPNPLRESFAVNRLQKSTLRNDTECKQLDNFRKETKTYETGFQTYSREDQEAMFSKVREMKESLINKDYMRSSINPRSSINSTKQTQPENNRQFDPRVENIDKINSKIKQILSCLENEKNPSKYLRESPKKSYMKDSAVAVTPPLERSVRKSYLKEQTRSIARDSVVISGETRSSYIFSKNPIGQSQGLNEKINSEGRERFQIESRINAPEKTYQMKVDISQQDKNELSIKKENPILKYQQEYSRTPVHKQIQSKIPLQASRSRSQVAFSYIAKDDTLKSGKKLNEEISRIQGRIEAMEREKKKLNIEFTPFSNKNRSTSALHTGTHFQSSIQSHKDKSETAIKPTIPHFRSASSTKDGIFSSQFCRNSESSDTRELKIKDDKKPLQESQPKLQLSLEQVDVNIKTVRIDKEDIVNEQASINNQYSGDFRQDYEDMKKRTDQGIQERKKRLQYSHNELIKTDSLKKLVSLFCQQAKLDEDFRNMKIWLEEVGSNEKNQKMSVIFAEKGLSFSPEECEVIFKLDQSENNPFYSVQGSQGSLQIAVNTFIEADKHWQGRVKRQFLKQSLIAEGFTKGKMDLERKGFIELQDLVRLLNIQSGTFYRNRDIFLIFKRLTGKERASFDDLLQELCP